MNKAELKKFAVEARRDLIEKVSLKAEQYGITKDNVDLTINEQYGQLTVNGREFPLEIKHALKTLEYRLKSIGYKQLIEEVSYTWFNRIIAIRYMEVNNYLPERVSILSSTTNKAEPDIFYQFETMELNVNISEINKLKREENVTKAYKKLFIAACNSLNRSLPTLFEKINDYTELLLPDYLLDEEFVISKLVNSHALDECFQEVEVIGWLYQYYNMEPKDYVFGKIKSKNKVDKYDIPAVTQFFTPKWIVQYMVENTLGKIWDEAYPKSNVKESFRNYIPPAEQKDNVDKKLEKVKYKKLDLEDIKIIDPCVGSGHLLVYAFDLLYKMYEEKGYLRKDIPLLILEKNLYGLDIDERATQLASFSLVMKGREKSRRILEKNIDLNIVAIQESNDIEIEELKKILSDNEKESEEIDTVLQLFLDSKTIGSAIIPPRINYNLYISKIDSLKEKQMTLETVNLFNQLDSIRNIFVQAYMLCSEYDVAITNPPYLGTKNLNGKAKKYLVKNYPDSKSDFYAVFLERIQQFTKKYGLNSTVTQHSWMFISTYEKLRKKIIKNQTLHNLLHLGARGFDDIGGEVVQTSAQTFRKWVNEEYKATFVRLVDYNTSTLKNENINNIENTYIDTPNEFVIIPGSPVAYWASEQDRVLFEKNDLIASKVISPSQNVTGNNKKYLRYFWEIDSNLCYLNGGDWRFYAKGGGYRKWSGNLIELIDWSSEARNAYRNGYASQIINEKFWYKEGITWGLVTSFGASFRYLPKHATFDKGGSSIFPNNDNRSTLYYILAFLNSKVAFYLLEFISPTLNFQVRDIKALPLIIKNFEIITKLTDEVLKISNDDWNTREVSWDFRTHQFLTCKNYSDNIIEDKYNEWVEVATNRVNKYRKIETEINKLFIYMYGLENKISPEIENKDITLLTPNKKEETKSFLSYFIGCVVGRYSLDVEGLVYAGGELNERSYTSFKPNKKGLVQFTENRYFPDDIIVRLKEFLSVAFSKGTVDENIKWLAEALAMRKNESPEERLRRYFMDEFFKDHCKTYQKRPIYWLVDSGKQKGLRTLIYMHRYQPDTMATIRFEHLQEIQSKYQNEIEMLDIRLSNPDISASDRRNLEKLKESYQKKIEELQEFDKKLAAYANEPIDIDLDDGVKVNYAKFQEILAKLK